MASKNRKRNIIVILISLILIALIAGYYFANIILLDNVVDNKEGYHYLYIKKSSTFEDLKTTFEDEEILNSVSNFEWVAKRKNYTTKIKPGRYLIKNGMSNSDIVNLLRSGKQEPVKLEFNSIRTREQLVSRIAQQLDIDSAELIKILIDKNYLKTIGLTPENSITVFIPNTYSVYWNITSKQLFDRMLKESDKYWNSSRKNKAKTLKLTLQQVITLASIVESETAKNDEKPIVAGAYLNRLKKDMCLEADPTLVFAVGDFSIRRVLNKHKEVDSPYNTYKNKGLPPGPICIPSTTSIDAVLNPAEHDYIYFCARESLDGYHNFAVTYKEHLANARRYQAALDRMNIKK